jgi:two-component system OmpR family sensor kinase
MTARTRRRTLRWRLAVLLALLLVVGMGAFGALAYWLFVRQQTAQLASLLERDLARVQALFESPVVGARLAAAGEGGFRLQFVSTAGEVVLPLDETRPLPLYRQPTVHQGEDGVYFVSSTTWTAPTGATLGTIRLALDFAEPLSVRRSLLQSLLLSGSLMTLLALLAGLVLLRRALMPLTELAARARRIDPAKPEATPYTGPDDEVADVAEALNTALEGIRERQALERASLAEIAHELAAPLTLVAAHLESLAAREDDPQLQAAKEAANELLYTSQDLLTLARGELERAVELEIVDLAGLARRVAWEYPGVSVSAPASLEVVGNPQRLSQLVRNLLRNAVQASNGTSGVALELACEGDEVVLSVADCGPGIAPEDLPHIFERFYSRRGGVGVGLSVAKRIAEQHRGTLSVSSRLGAGTRFTLHLPGLETQLEP